MNTLLAWLMLSVPFVVALGLGVAVPLLALALYRRVGAGLVFVAFFVAADAVFFGSARLQVGLNLYVNDLVYGLLGAVAAARWAMARDMPARPGAWVVFVLLFFASLGWGLATHGTPAGVQARDLFYGIVAASYFMSFPIGERSLRQALGAAVVLSLVLLAVAAYRWVAYALPVPSLLPPGGVWSADGPTRVIPSHEALLLAQVLVLGLFFHRAGAGLPLARWLAPLTLAAVVALQHRSVWVALFIGLVAALALAQLSRGQRALGGPWGQAVALLAVVTATALPLVFSERLSRLTQEVGQSAATAVAGQGTVHARLQDWRVTLRQWVDAGPQAILVGQGFGRDTARVLINERGERRVVTFGAHNHYVSLLTQMGVLGLAAFLAFLARVVWRAAVVLRRDPGPPSLLAAAGLAVLTMQLAYYVPYGSDHWQHALLGLLAAFGATRHRQIDRPQREAARQVPLAQRIVA